MAGGDRRHHCRPGMSGWLSRKIPTLKSASIRICPDSSSYEGCRSSRAAQVAANIVGV